VLLADGMPRIPLEEGGNADFHIQRKQFVFDRQPCFSRRSKIGQGWLISIHWLLRHSYNFARGCCGCYQDFQMKMNDCVEAYHQARHRILFDRAW
jgi:hypothetical protein